MQHRKKQKSPALFLTSLIAGFFIALSLTLPFVLPYVQHLMHVESSMWALFALVSGILTLVLPCTFPLVFLIRAKVREGSALSAVKLLLFFAIGVIVMQSFYGALFGFVGMLSLSALQLNWYALLPWVYLFAGVFTYMLALGELGMIPFRMPVYVGKGPKFLHGQNGFKQALLLGIFLGGIGVASTSPATPLLMVNALTSGNAGYGFLLFFIHAIGRVLPLFFVLMFSIIGVSIATALVKRKEFLEKLHGWFYLLIGSLLVSMALFSSLWMIKSRFWENIVSVFYTGENLLYHPAIGSAMSLPFTIGGWMFVFLLLLPLWIYYGAERKRVLGSPIHQLHRIEFDIMRLEEEWKSFEVSAHVPDRAHEVLRMIEALETKARIVEDGLRYHRMASLREKKEQEYEEELLRLKRNWYASITLLLIIGTILFL